MHCYWRRFTWRAGAKIARLHEEGYGVDADRELDELHERMENWRKDEAA